MISSPTRTCPGVARSMLFSYLRDEKARQTEKRMFTFTRAHEDPSRRKTGLTRLVRSAQLLGRIRSTKILPAPRVSNSIPSPASSFSLFVIFVSISISFTGFSGNVSPRIQVLQVSNALCAHRGVRFFLNSKSKYCFDSFDSISTEKVLRKCLSWRNHLNG